jgi:hypothetical protein
MYQVAFIILVRADTNQGGEGFTGIAVEHYVNDWIVSIEDITPLCKKYILWS